MNKDFTEYIKIHVLNELIQTHNRYNHIMNGPDMREFELKRTSRKNAGGVFLHIKDGSFEDTEEIIIPVKYISLNIKEDGDIILKYKEEYEYNSYSGDADFNYKNEGVQKGYKLKEILLFEGVKS